VTSPHPPPSCQVPRPTSLTTRPVLPKCGLFMRRNLGIFGLRQAWAVPRPIAISPDLVCRGALVGARGGVKRRPYQAFASIIRGQKIAVSSPLAIFVKKAVGSGFGHRAGDRDGARDLGINRVRPCCRPPVSVSEELFDVATGREGDAWRSQPAPAAACTATYVTVPLPSNRRSGRHQADSPRGSG